MVVIATILIAIFINSFSQPISMDFVKFGMKISLRQQT